MQTQCKRYYTVEYSKREAVAQQRVEQAVLGPAESDKALARPAMRHPLLVLGGAVVGLIVGNGPMLQFTFGVFLTSLTGAFGANRQTISTALFAGLVANGLTVPLFGRLVDRFGIARVTYPAVILAAAAIASLGLVKTSSTGFILLYAAAGLAWGGQTPLPYARAVVAAFGRRRGLALGIAMAGVGLGSAFVPILAERFIALSGWRQAYALLGLMTLALGIPAVWLIGSFRAGTAAQGVSFPGLSARASAATPAFWLMAGAFFLVTVVASGTTAHLVPLITDTGIARPVAARALGIAGLALIVGRVVGGWLLDRLFAPHVAVGFFLLLLGGVLILLGSASLPAAFAAAALIGLGLGGEVDLIAYLVSRYFGLRAFGQIYGWLFAIFMFGGGSGPLVMGTVYTHTGSYNAALWLFVGALLIACLLISRLGTYVFATDLAHQ